MTTIQGQEIGAGALFIGGEFVSAQGGHTFETINPANETVITSVAEGRAADIDKAVAAARAALPAWAAMAPAQRGRLLYKAADIMSRRRERLAILETVDQGKPITEASMGDVPLAIKMIRYFAGWADKISGETLPVASRYHAFTRREPIGVVGQIIPWNFPLLIACWKLAPALAMGNTVVLKPAEQTPLSALELADIFREAGIPAGVLNVVPGYGPTAGAALVEHPGVDKIAFTGSTATGKTIMRSCAESLKRVSLELGGKSPNVVFQDADLKAAVYGAIGGIFYNKGEVCAAGSRLFVQRAVHEEFMETLLGVTAKRLQDDPFNPKTRVGPQVSQVQRQRVLGYVDQAISEGAKLVAGGKANQIDGKGFYVQPTIFDEVDNQMTIAREEVFGPVLSVIPFDDYDDAVAKANDSLYGLASGIWTADIKKAHRFARDVQAGTVWVNCYNVFDPAGPFGGLKQSGFGRDLGQEAALDYTELKTVWVDLN